MASGSSLNLIRMNLPTSNRLLDVRSSHVLEAVGMCGPLHGLVARRCYGDGAAKPQGLVLGLVPVPGRAGRAARGTRRCHTGLPWFGFIKRTAQLVRTRTLQAQPSYSPLAP